MWFCSLYINFVEENCDKTILKFHIFQRSQKCWRFTILEISKMLDQESNNRGGKVSTIDDREELTPATCIFLCCSLLWPSQLLDYVTLNKCLVMVAPH